MHERVDLNDEVELVAFRAPELDQPVEDRLPVLVAREIVVGDEEVIDALRDIGANDRLDVVGRAVAAFAALHVDDGAERALERTAAPRVEAGDDARGALDAGRVQNRDRRALDARQVVHKVIERLQFPRIGVFQKDIEPALGFAREQRDAHRLRLFEVIGHLRKHRQTARDMEPADGDLHAARAKALRQVHGAGELVGLHAHQTNNAAPARCPDLARDSLGAHARIGLIEGRDRNLDVLAEDAPRTAIGGEAGHDRERIGGNGRDAPLNDVSVVVVVRRLDQIEAKAAGHMGLPEGRRPNHSALSEASKRARKGDGHRRDARDSRDAADRKGLRA